MERPASGAKDEDGVAIIDVTDASQARYGFIECLEDVDDECERELYVVDANYFLGGESGPNQELIQQFSDQIVVSSDIIDIWVPKREFKAPRRTKGCPMLDGKRGSMRSIVASQEACDFASKTTRKLLALFGAC